MGRKKYPPLRQSTTQTIKLEIHFQQSWSHNSKFGIWHVNINKQQNWDLKLLLSTFWCPVILPVNLSLKKTYVEGLLALELIVQLLKNISPNLTVTHWIPHKLEFAAHDAVKHVTVGVIFTKLMTFKLQKPAANIRITSMGQGHFLPWDLQMWVKESEVMLSVSKTNYNRNLTIWSKICIYFLKLAAFWAVAFWHNFILNMEVK